MSVGEGDKTQAASLRQQWNDTCLQAGIPSLTLATCAKLMAVLLHFGNNEAFVLSTKFRADCDYIQKRYHLSGGEVPDADFVAEFQMIEKDIGCVSEPPAWAKKLLKDMYNINI